MTALWRILRPTDILVITAFVPQPLSLLYDYQDFNKYLYICWYYSCYSKKPYSIPHKKLIQKYRHTRSCTSTDVSWLHIPLQYKSTHNSTKPLPVMCTMSDFLAQCTISCFNKYRARPHLINVPVLSALRHFQFIHSILSPHYNQHRDGEKGVRC